MDSFPSVFKKKIVFNQRTRTYNGNYTHIIYKKKIKFDFGHAVA